MTQKYIYIREEICSIKMNDSKGKRRTFAEMREVFTFFGWIIPISLIILGITYFILLFTCTEFSWKFAIGAGICMVLSAYVPDRVLYKEEARVKELKKVYERYDEDANQIVPTIRKHICSYEKLMKLKSECEEVIKKYEDKRDRIKKRIFELSFVVPVTALILNIISPSEQYPIFIAIAGILIVGYLYMFIELVMKLVQKLSQDYKKDKYLLELINELDYSQKALDSIFKVKENN